jgi:ABC-type transporter Mla subunit MlaD
MTSRYTDVLLGLLFFGSLIGLGVATIALSDYQFGEPRYQVEILSPDVGYLRPGDPVLLFGMPAGKVVAIERLPEPESHELTGGWRVECRVRVITSLEVDVYRSLPVDSELIIEDRGLLGGKLIRVETGSSPNYVPRDKPLVAVSAASALQSASEVLSENRENLRRTLDSLTQMVEQANRGGGLLGAMLWDEPLKRNVQETAEDLREAADAIQRGEGTLGRLIMQDDMYTEAQGTVDDAQGFFASAREVADRINAGEGTVGQLVTNDELYESARTFFADVQANKGLLGALIADEELATKFRHIVDQVLGAVEDARESSPVQSAGSFIFGTF